MTAPIAVPPAAAPELSVVVVTFNAWEWTARALRALVDTTPVPFELIIVDNASTDATGENLDGAAGARVVRNAVNVHFGPAADLGAMLARAPTLLFLNTDAVVQPGWLPPLRAVLDAEDDVAAVTPRLLHLDGRLQEAGSVVWGDGATENYGDNDDAGRPEYGFRRDVDYASAACLLVRRSAFCDAGGFDPVFHPSYYEDVDLAMRWRSVGLRVVYQPASTVVHKRWASSGGRAGMVDLLLRNRAVFLDRWRDVLVARPARPARVDPAMLLALRDAECHERVLLVGDAAALGVPGAGQVASDRGLAPRGWRVSALRVDAGGSGGADGDAEAAVLRSAGIEVVTGGQDVRAWLDGRRHHHTIVAADAGLPEGLAAALRGTQPSALRVALVGRARVPDGPAGWLRHCGLALCDGPEAESWARRAGPGVRVGRAVTTDTASVLAALAESVAGISGG